MQDTMLLGLEGIRKTILHGGTGDIPRYITGAKVCMYLHRLVHKVITHQLQNKRFDHQAVSLHQR
ncbi:Aryl-hydrocarbon-interacting protein-like 1 [Liparis tanakae]|uniref:Aryl-hydrocarbon-interacting protein-like 1 n=1 Tax=Liparis tanakae TaxID=230148 RepID=A0A4Z2E6H2_9TELE|nr:Aryl-hydrocarbon-interacting protein-like 1 [Liparis tanakae]